VPVKKHVPPDVAAAFIWLKNRRPAEWKDRHEVTGKDGGAIEMNISARVEIERRLEGLAQRMIDVTPASEDPPNKLPKK
jgi:hypothetical protein